MVLYREIRGDVGDKVRKRWMVEKGLYFILAFVFS